MWIKIKEFKTSINEGDVVDLSIGVVAGVAFVTLAEAFTVGLVASFVRIILGTDGAVGEFVVARQVFDISLVVAAIITFAIEVWVIHFVFVVPTNRFRARRAFDTGSDEHVELLREIRDLMKEPRP
ncbi:MscL family protein [Actinomycetota bacterium]|nr:MscL family protein [Actinomycetota bacterium]